MLLLSDSRFEAHTPPPGHPERPERAHVFDAVAARWRERGGGTVEPRPATLEELARVHDGAYLDRLAATAGRAVMLDPDTFTSSATYDIAVRAAGAAVQAVEHAIDAREPAFALVRPPGHHAERDRARGFCFLNNVAIAAAAALDRGVPRVAVVDIDVHHGNGTQFIFYRDPRVLYVSAHQHPFYPGTGAADETGDGDGEGFTVNVPLEAGSTDADYELVHRAIVEPVLDQFAPDLLIVSAGYDAHERDPLASMRVTSAGYAAMIGRLKTVADRHGVLALVTEGGYELTALAECLEGSFAAVAKGTAPLSDPPAAPAPKRGERAVAAVRAAQAPYWRAI